MKCKNCNSEMPEGVTDVCDNCGMSQLPPKVEVAKPAPTSAPKPKVELKNVKVTIDKKKKRGR